MSIINETSNWIRNSVTLKLALIGFLVLILLIPASMIQELIQERSRNNKQVITEISDKWGKKQEITGPVLTVPYMIIGHENGKVVKSVSYAHFLPEKLNVQGVLLPEIRKRNIYKVILYTADVSVQGYFSKPDFKMLNIANENILWNEAFISVGIPDMRGIKNHILISWNNKKYTANPGMLNRDIITSGISTHIPVNTDSLNTFEFNLKINGSESISFQPLGKETQVSVESSWDSPKFSGAFLPEKREVTNKGFKAEWKVLHLNRNYPQQWTSSDNQSLDESGFGVELLFPVDHYQKSARSAKYAVMFLFLTFLVFFANEVLNRKRIHPVQYLMIGIALIIFYTLLVSISEYAGFNIAYALSGILTISLITIYAFGILGKKGGLAAGAILIMLYGFLFVLLQLEDYSLLIGSAGLFLILGGAMVASRKIDWYSTGKISPEVPEF